MRSPTALAIGVGTLAALVLLGLWSVGSRDADVLPDGSSRPGTGEERAPASLEPLGERTPPREGAKPDERTVLGDADAAPPSPVARTTAEAETDPLDDPGFRLEGRVVDDAGRGIEGATVETPSGDVLAVSGAEGRIDTYVERVPESSPFLRPGQIGVFATGHVAEWIAVPVRARETSHLGTIVLARGGVVFGRVTDEGGEPVLTLLHFRESPAARVGATGLKLSTRTDAEGLYRLRGLPLGSGVVFSSSGLRRPTESEPFAMEAGAEIRRDLVVPTPEGLLLRVVDPAGEPVAGAGVSLVSQENQAAFTRSDEEGEARLRLEDTSGNLRAQATHGRFGATDVVEVTDATAPVLLRFEHSGELAIRVAEPLGTAIPWSRVEIEEELPVLAGILGVLADLGYGNDASVDSTGSKGVARVRRPRAAFEVRASAPGYRAASFGPFHPRELGDELVVLLDPAEVLEGFVTLDGRPVANARVALVETLAEGRIAPAVHGSKPVEAPFTLLVGTRTELHEVATAPDGSYVVTMPAAGTYALQLRGSGFPRTLTERRRLGGGPSERWDVELERAGAIEGRVIDVLRDEPTRVVAVCAGDGIATTAITDERGRFRVDDLAPGDYQVRPWELPTASAVPLRAGPPEDGRLEADCTVRAGRTTRFDLDLRAQNSVVVEVDAPADLEVREVVLAAGPRTPAEDRHVVGRMPGGDGFPTRFGLSRTGDYVVSFERVTLAAVGDWKAERVLTAEVGLNEVELAPRHDATIAAGPAPAELERPWFQLEIETPDGWWWSRWIRPKEAILSAPAGRVRLLDGDDSLPWHERILFDADAPPGGRLELVWPAR